MKGWGDAELSQTSDCAGCLIRKIYRVAQSPLVSTLLLPGALKVHSYRMYAA